MKQIKIGLIILICLTVVNVVTWQFLDTKIGELKTERGRIIHSNWELLETGDIKDIFDYIQARNQKLSTRELADYVSYVFQLSDDYQNSKYPVTPWEIFEISDIESDFRLNARGASGEAGPMQIMPGTWKAIYKRFGFRPADFENWYCNMAVATYHYSELKTICCGDSIEAIGRYNGGAKWRDKHISRNHVRKYQRVSRGISKVRRI